MKREEITFHDFCVNELQIHSALAPWAVDHTWQFQQKRIDELQAKEKNNGWISVDERLPEFGVAVLAGHFAGKTFHFHYYERFDDADGWLWARYSGDLFSEPQIDDDYSYITHWQPLPPAPEQVK